MLGLSVLLAASFKLGDAVVSLSSNDTSDVLEVVQEYFPLLLLLGVLVEFVDLGHVRELLIEVFFGVHQGVEEVAVLAVLL